MSDALSPRNLMFANASRRLNTHIQTCGPCRSGEDGPDGDDFAFCPTAERLLDDLDVDRILAEDHEMEYAS